MSPNIEDFSRNNNARQHELTIAGAKFWRGTDETESHVAVVNNVLPSGNGVY
jgi:hypothetical protein